MVNIFYRKQYKKIGSSKNNSLEIIIDTKIVTRELIEYISANEDCRRISFTDKVKIIGKNCFYHMNIDNVSFNSATNLKEIHESAFKKAYRLHCVDCFENVEILEVSAFEETKSEDTIYMPKVQTIPSCCFKNSKFLSIITPNATDIASDAFDGISVEKASPNI